MQTKQLQTLLCEVVADGATGVPSAVLSAGWDRSPGLGAQQAGPRCVVVRAGQGDPRPPHQRPVAPCTFRGCRVPSDSGAVSGSGPGPCQLTLMCVSPARTEMGSRTPRAARVPTELPGPPAGPVGRNADPSGRPSELSTRSAAFIPRLRPKPQTDAELATWPLDYSDSVSSLLPRPGLANTQSQGRPQEVAGPGQHTNYLLWACPSSRGARP